MTNKDDFLFVEKYRPNTVSDCVLPKNLRKIFQDIVDTKNIPHMMLSGPAGTGKTTVAKALCNELGCDYMMINCSENGNIDTLRTKIRQFASTVSFSSNSPKVVILDEFDFSNCVADTETILLSNGDYRKLEELEIGKEYDIISFDPITKQFENDKAFRFSSGVKEIFEIEFEDGTSVHITADHVLICVDNDGNIVEKCINDGLDGVSVVALD
jgi:hypothetical protein